VIAPRALGLEASWGAPGLALAGSFAGWIEFALLRRTLNSRIGAARVDRQFLRRLWLATGLAALFSWGLLSLIADLHPLIVAAIVLGCYLLSYLSITLTYEIPEAQRLVARVWRRRPPGAA
jgi:peptidoglycan biosynthesis protein MviN/MurJ (putative lipid II flippase)